MYKIVKTELDVPLRVGVLTNYGVITVCRGTPYNEPDEFYCENDYSKELYPRKWVTFPTPISISLQKIPKLDERNVSFVQEKATKFIKDVIFPENIKCHQAFQLILLNKLNQGIDTIHESEIQLCCNKYLICNSNCRFDGNEIAILKAPIKEVTNCYTCGTECTIGSKYSYFYDPLKRKSEELNAQSEDLNTEFNCKFGDEMIKELESLKSQCYDNRQFKAMTLIQYKIDYIIQNYKR